MNSQVTFAEDTKRVHRNRPQVEMMAVLSRIMILLWGRATGKTKGGSGPLVYLYATGMPGSVGALGCDSFKHLKKEILPELERTWKEDFGLVKGRDYWINKFPPKELNIPEAIRPVSEPDNCIFWRNGSVTKLFSFNFSSLQNGDSIDYLVVEEGKLVKPERLNETILCVRGNDNVFGHMSIHKSIVIISDMPDFVKGMYLLDYEKQMNNEHIQVIKLLSIEISKLTLEKEGGVTVRRAREIDKIIADLEERRTFLRKYSVFVSYASTLENVHTLGMDVITNYKKTLTPEKFRLSVLSLRPQSIGDSYYNFSDKHAYVAMDADYINKLSDQTKPDCRWDLDVDNNLPLELSGDYNAAITSLAVGQFHPGELKLLNTLYVYHPKRLPHAIKKFHEYYKHLPNKVINFHYDGTATGTDALRTEEETFRAVVIDELTKLGWDVYDYMYGQTSHAKRYEMWSQCFEEDPEFPFVFRYNKENCRDWEYAASHTPLRIRHFVVKGVKKAIIEKNKDSEKDKKLPQIQATHITEAVDGLFVAYYEQCTVFSGGMMSIR